MADTEKRLLALQRSIEELYDNQVRQRRMLADLLYNLDEENMPGVKALIERYKAEDGEAIAALKLSSDQNCAAIESLAAVQSDQQESIAGVNQKASTLEAEIESLVSVQTEQGKNIAGVSQRADNIEADIESLASVQTEQGKNIAGVSQRADNIEADIESLTSVQTEQGKNIAGVSQRADDIEAEIESLASVQTEHGKSIASIEQSATELGAEVVLAVEKASSAESAASAAEIAASSAESKANAAETAASSAESKASAAQNTANTAKTTADTAKTTADSAESTANAAKTTADTAESTANAAESTANTAKSTADDAIGKVSDGAYIIARVNETSSSVKINTDKLNLSGYATSASVEQTADELGARIESLASVQTEHGKSIASIEQNATELGAEVVLAVEKASSAESAASAAETAASSAESKASAAESAASSAESKASAAEDTANTAKTTADTAKTTADSAKTTANAAESTANAAESTANAAETTANAAKSTADDAIGKVSDGAYIIARVNETSSSVKINTDKLNLSGYATSASVEQTADELGARIESLASVQTEHGKNIASIEQSATELGAEVVLAVEKASSAESAASAAESAASSAESKASAAQNTANTAKTTADSAKTTANAAESTANAAESTANAAESTANAAESTANAAKSTADDALGKVSDGAYIIARVNEDGSLVKIKADKLELSGYATFLSLRTAGATEIDGANLKTGTVSTDRIALNENGQINFDKLGTLSFSEPSGASGEMRISENEYGKGEIGINADGTVALGAGSASFILLDTGNGSTEASVDASSFRMNGKRGISGTYYFGNGSITVENGIVTAMTSDSGEYEPVELSAPEVYLDGEYCYYSISNPNGIGTIFFRTYWYDNYGGEWESELEYSDDLSVSGYISEFPSNGGYIGVRAWVEYGESVSDTASSESSYA